MSSFADTVFIIFATALIMLIVFWVILMVVEWNNIKKGIFDYKPYPLKSIFCKHDFKRVYQYGNNESKFCRKCKMNRHESKR